MLSYIRLKKMVVDFLWVTVLPCSGSKTASVIILSKSMEVLEANWRPQPSWRMFFFVSSNTREYFKTFSNDKSDNSIKIPSTSHT